MPRLQAYLDIETRSKKMENKAGLVTIVAATLLAYGP
jgi:hypothetical protein